MLIFVGWFQEQADDIIQERLHIVPTDQFPNPLILHRELLEGLEHFSVYLEVSGILWTGIELCILDVLKRPELHNFHPLLLELGLQLLDLKDVVVHTFG